MLDFKIMRPGGMAPDHPIRIDCTHVIRADHPSVSTPKTVLLTLSTGGTVRHVLQDGETFDEFCDRLSEQCKARAEGAGS